MRFLRDFFSVRTTIASEHEKRDVINVSLVCDYEMKSNKWWIEAEAKLKLFSSKEDKQPIEIKLPKNKFMDCSRMSKLIDFIKYEDIVNHENGYNQNGFFSFECTITSKQVFKESCLGSHKLQCTKSTVHIGDRKC